MEMGLPVGSLCGSEERSGLVVFPCILNYWKSCRHPVSLEFTSEKVGAGKEWTPVCKTLPSGPPHCFILPRLGCRHHREWVAGVSFGKVTMSKGRGGRLGCFKTDLQDPEKQSFLVHVLKALQDLLCPSFLFLLLL